MRKYTGPPPVGYGRVITGPIVSAHDMDTLHIMMTMPHFLPKQGFQQQVFQNDGYWCDKHTLYSSQRVIARAFKDEGVRDHILTDMELQMFQELKKHITVDVRTELFR